MPLRGNGPIAGVGSKFDYTFTGSFSLTRGGVTQTSSGFGALAIDYIVEDPSIGGARTVLLIEAPNADGTGGPGLGAAASAREWGIGLQGMGNLLPNGFAGTLPPLSAWNVKSGDYIMQTNAFIDAFGACPGSDSGATIAELALLLGDPNALAGSCNCGYPINLGNGNMFEQAADYQTSGLNKLSFTRYYNSLATSTTFATTLGTNWRSNYDRYLRLSSASSVIAERPDGQQVTFTLTSGAWTTDTDIDLKLTSSGSTWTLTDNHDTVETYTTSGASEALLQTIRARNGYAQTLQYGAGNQPTTVTDSYNRQLSFTYSSGKLQTVTTPDSLILTFGYTGALLSSAGYSTSPLTSQAYVYEDSAHPAALTGIIDENGNRYATWTYDAMGRATSSQHANGANLTKIAYNDTDGSRTVTNPLGVQEIYKFTTLQRVPKVTEADRVASSSLPAAIRKFTYDSNGYLASKTDWNGNVTNYVNNAHGQPTTINEAVGTPQARTTTVSYHATFHLPLRIVTPGLTSAFTYDNNGELLTKTLSDTTTTTTPYATVGQTRTWTYSWSNFLPASTKRPRADINATTSFTYDSSGALTAFTNALGQSTQITQHLPGGMPQTIVDANSVTTNLTYDPRLRLLTNTVSTAAGPMIITYSYDAAGNRISVTKPDGSSYTNTYDAAHRRTAVTDILQQTVAFTLDVQGDRTQANTTDASGAIRRTHSSKYDAIGRMQQDIGGTGQITSFSYDANGNILSLTDPLGRVTHDAFDALNRLFAITDPLQGVTSTTFDAHDRPTKVTDPNGAVTTYVYDGFGDVIQRVSPDSGTTVYHYDADGNLTQRVDGAGAVTNYAFDALDRVISASYPADAAENVTYTYDQGAFGIGRLTAIGDAAGTLSRSYDERGNILSETRVNGAVTLITSYTYDAANRIASIMYPSGWAVAYTRDVMGRTTAVTAQPAGGGAPVPVVSSAGYQPFGPVNSLTFGDGVADTRTFDPDYRMTSLVDMGSGPIQNLSYAYDAAGNVSSITDGVTTSNGQTLAYDVLNRLTSANGSYGAIAYTYDNAGNRVTQNVGGSPVSYSYTAHSNQLAGIGAGGASQPVSYTKAGHINSFSTGGTAMNLTYNQAGQLVAATSASGVAAQYNYDAFGRRGARTGAVTATTLYQYDLRNRLLEETDGQGNPVVDYVYLGSLPVGTISPVDGQVYFLHSDRLGTPQLATDNGQNIAWSASYGPFGEMSAVPSGIVQNLRMPGQEFDVETGLYHNGFRDYSSALGRYLQTDPIGLAGGLNTYGYARANPVRSIDPLGLCDLADAAAIADPTLLEDVEKAHNIEDVFGILKGFYNGATASPEDIQAYLSSPHVPSEEDAAELAGIVYNLANAPAPTVTYTEEEWQAEYGGANADYLVSRYLALKQEEQNLAAIANNSGISYVGSDVANQLAAVKQVLTQRGYSTP